MKLYGDYHTHTNYSHGKGNVQDVVEEAVKKGLKEIAITDHGFNSVFCGMTPDKVLKCKKDIETLQAKHNDIKILMGIESNIIGFNGEADLKEEYYKYFDVILCGYHLPALVASVKNYYKLHFRMLESAVTHKISERQKEKNTKAYINVIKKYPVDIITHINSKLKVNVGEVADCCSDYGVYLELSCRHESLTEKDIEDMLKTPVKFIINSDAHDIKDVGVNDYAFDLVKKYGIENRVVNLDQKPIFKKSNC